MFRSTTSIRLCFLASLAIYSAGCGSPPPLPKSELPKDTIRLAPLASDPDAPEEFSTTDSGLKYRILRKSDGKKPTMTDYVRLHYRARREDGSILRSTYGKFGAAEYAKMVDVPKGNAEGMQLTGEGGLIELIIPPELAYGDMGGQTAPPTGTLHFTIEILEVRPMPVQQTSDAKSVEAAATVEGEKKE